MQIVYLGSVEGEIQAAYEQCGGPDTERAELFLKRLDRTWQLLSENPAMGPKYGGRFRRLAVRDFPYGIFYTVTGHRIFISAVLDLRQDPATLHRRLGL